uniref:Uncharacterized protein n=1 Tax=Rhizophora mucronata TaxID=61149 RepID=A0A2P2J482_RHIMU
MRSSHFILIYVICYDCLVKEMIYNHLSVVWSCQNNVLKAASQGGKYISMCVNFNVPSLLDIMYI